MENNSVFDKSGKSFSTLINDKDREAIFLAQNRLIDNSINGILTDEDMPDIKRYIFSTMGSDLVSINRSNMVNCIRTKANLNNYIITNELARIVDKNLSATPIGVFVIDYYCYYNDFRINLDHILKFYCMNGGATNIDPDISSAIADDIFRKGFLNKTPSKYEIKILTFIPKDEILANGFVYIPTVDLCICKNKVNDTITHPFSNGVVNFDTIHKFQNGTVSDINKIFIEIVDNDSIKPYYINIGNEVHKIFSTKNINKHNQVKMFIQKNGGIYKDEIVTLDQCNKLGLYSTYDEADSFGNISKKIESDKLKLEFEKISMEKNKLEHNLEVLNIELEQLKDKHRMDMIKRKEDLNFLITKNSLDLNYMKTKETLGLKTAIIKSIGEIKANDLKIQNESASITNKKIDNGLKIVSLINTIIKIIF